MRLGILILALICIIAGCGADRKNQTVESSLKQQPADLLAGQVTAVAYSGFRDGQHPDRGDGAVLPSDEEILEDLRILTRDGNFSLIRLYDSKQNSQDVLRLIRDEPMPVGDLARELSVSQPAVSQHLAVLRDAGLVTVEPDGRRRLYRADTAALADVQAFFDDYWSDSVDRLATAAERAAANRRVAS